MKYYEILKQVADKGTLIGQCAEVWLKGNRKSEYGKIYILECSEMTRAEWVRKLWGDSLVNSIQQYAKNYRGKRKPDISSEKIIGETIRKLRLERRIKQSVLAASINITQGQLSKIENGDCELSFSQIEKISNALCVPSYKILPA